MGCHFLLQGIFLTQGLNPGLPHCRQMLSCLSHGCENGSQSELIAEDWCFLTVVLEKTLEHPLDCKEVKPVVPKRNQSWIFIGRTDAEAEASVLWSPDVKNWLIRKDPDTGKDWRREEKETTEGETVGWYHQLNVHEFDHALGVGMDREAYCAVDHGVATIWTRLSNWTGLNWTWIYGI